MRLCVKDLSLSITIKSDQRMPQDGNGYTDKIGKCAPRSELLNKVV